MLKIRSGVGYDIHSLKKGNGLMLGGICIADDLEFEAHSDGDVLIHALIDSLLGAIGEGDIGEKFPDSESKYKGISSSYLLKECIALVEKHKFEIMNIDCIVIAEEPKLTPYKEEIRTKITDLLKIPRHDFNIKAKTKEKLDSVGRGEAIECYCVSLLRSRP